MGEFVVKFVLVHNSNEDAIADAAKAVKNAGLQTEKISQDQVVEITQKDSCLYVCDPFEGAAFDHLVKHECRIIGPQCVLSCLQEEVPIPKANHPIYNISLQGVEISCSSIEKHDRENIHKCVEWMGGRVSRSFTETVTHLIAGEVGSKKYFVAADLQKPIMLPDWVFACWEKSQGKHFCGTSSEIIKQFSCPVFKGCIVCVTGIESDERKQVKKMVDQCGGRYTGELKFKECTHLIVNVNGPKGQKYEFGRKWKIPCVTIKWFHDSIEKGSCQNEDLYRVGSQQQGENRSSTPKGQRGMPSRLSSIADCSAINATTVNMSTVNETAMTTGYESIMVPPAAVTEKLNSSLEELDGLNVSDCDGNLFLDGCKILLSGFSGNRLEKLRKVINTGGGTRFNQLNASVSHVIIGNKVQEHHDLLLQGKFRPAVVSAQWIIDSFKQGAQLDEGQYGVLDIPADQTTSPQVRSKLPVARDTSTSNDETRVEDGDKTVAEPDDVMAMYMDQSKADGNRTMDDEITFNPKADVQPEKEEDETQIEQENMDITAYIQQDGVGIFAGKTFFIMGFLPEQESQIKEMISPQQGTVLAANSRRIADYAIVPVTGCEVKTTVNEVTTNCWLQMCIENEECLDPSSNALFSPVVLVQDVLALQGCVLSISQYAGVERDCLLHLAELLGATCQEYFVRKPNGALKANTHLLLKEADGSKYKAAKKWKIPTVTKEWLLECAKTGKKQPERNFPLEAQETMTSSQAAQPKTAPENNTVAKDNSTEQFVEFKQPELPSATKGNAKRTRVDSKENQRVDVDEDVSTSAKISKRSRGSEGYQSMNVEEDVSTPSTSAKIPKRSRGSEGFQNDLPDRTSNKSATNATDSSNTVLPSSNRGESGPEDHKENQHTPTASKATNKHLTAVKGAGAVKGVVGVDTPSKFLGDNCNFRPSFDLDDVNAYLESPLSQRRKSSMHRRKSSLPLDDLLSFNLAKAVAKMADDPADEGESQSQDDSVFHEKPPGVLDGVVICVGKKLSKKQGDYNGIAESLGAEYKWLYDESCTHFLFQGRANDLTKEYKVAKEQGKMIVSPFWLHACENENAHVEESLYPHTYNPKMTLPVMSSKTPARNTPARPTKGKATPARATRQSARKVVKHTSIVAQPAQVSPPQQPEVAQDGFEKDSTDSDEEMMRITEAAEDERPDNEEKDQQQEPAKGRVNPPDLEEEGSLEMRETFQKQFEEIMTSTLSAKSGRRKSRRQTASTSNLSGSDADGGSGSARRTRSKRPTLAETSEDREMEQKLGRPIESSQSVQITWDDPTSRKEREKIMAQLNEESPVEAGQHAKEQESERPRRTPRKSVKLNDKKDAPNQPANMEDSPPTPTPTAPPIRLPVAKPAVAPQPRPVSAEALPEQRQQRTTPKFLLSGMSSEEKVDYGALIEKIGGEVKDAQYFDPSCTHIVVGNPTRNEKYLASLASGKWVLHKSYLESCREQGVLVEEADHEWGSATDLNSIPPQTAKLARAATRWRQSLDEERKKSNYQIIPGAFDGWQVLLHVDRARESGFKRLLQAGGAKIIGMRPPFADFENASHGFFDFGKAKSSSGSVDLEAIVSAGVLCLKPEYIAQYLMEEPLPDPANYCISEVKTILQRLNSFSERSAVQTATPTPTKRKRETSMGTNTKIKKAKR